MSRLVFCDLCDTNLGVLFERDGDAGAPTLDLLPHHDCWHVTRQALVEDLEALHAGESSLPFSLKGITTRVRQLSHWRNPARLANPYAPSSLGCSGGGLSRNACGRAAANRGDV